MNSAVALEIAILIAALAWKGQQLRRGREFATQDVVARWTIAVAIAALLLVWLGQIPPRLQLATWVTQLVAYGQNVGLIATFVALQLLYLGYRPVEGRRHSGQREIAIAGTILLAMAAIMVWTLSHGGVLRYSEASLANPLTATYYMLAHGYNIYATSSQVFFGVRYARRSKLVIRRVALLLTAAGMLLLLAAILIRTVTVLRALFSAGFSPEALVVFAWLKSVGNIIVVVGLMLPVVVRTGYGVTRWWRAHRLFRDLGPLHQLVSWAYPELIYPPAPAEPAPTSAHNKTPGANTGSILFRTTRRRTECRDGYDQLVAHLHNNPLPDRTRISRAAAELRAIGPLEASAAVSTDESDGRQAYKADTAQLVAVSRALAGRDLSWCRPTPGQPTTSESEEYA